MANIGSGRRDFWFIERNPSFLVKKSPPDSNELSDTSVGEPRTPRTLSSGRCRRTVAFGLASALLSGNAFAQMTTHVDLSAPSQLVAEVSKMASGPTMKLPPSDAVEIIAASRQLTAPRLWKPAPQTTLSPPIDLIRRLPPYSGPTMKIVPFPLAAAPTQESPK